MSQVASSNPILTGRRSSIASSRAAGAIIAVSLALSLVACVSDDPSRNIGERMSDRGDEIGSYGAAWSEGRQNVKQGEKTIEQIDRSRANGERDMAKARKELAKAEQQINDAAASKAAALKRIEDGRIQMARAEADYAATKAGPSAVADPDY